MKIELRIDVTSGSARRIAVVGITLLIVGAAAVAYASQIRFTSGQMLTAADLNNNFDELYTRLATLESRSASSFCGATPSNYNGAQVGGYTRAKTLCTPVCGNVPAHMCTLHDALSLWPRTQLAKGWISGPVASSAVNMIPNDCAQWATGDGVGVSRGAYWDPAVTGYQLATCDTSLAVLCYR